MTLYAMGWLRSSYHLRSLQEKLSLECSRAIWCSWPFLCALCSMRPLKVEIHRSTISTDGFYTMSIIALCNKGWHFWKGGFVTDKTRLKIFVFINAMIFAFTTFVTNTPLYGKIASKVWKIYFQYISPHFLDAAGSQISDLWLLLLSNSSLFSALMSHLPLLLLHSALTFQRKIKISIGSPNIIVAKIISEDDNDIWLSCLSVRKQE